MPSPNIVPTVHSAQSTATAAAADPVLPEQQRRRRRRSQRHRRRALELRHHRVAGVRPAQSGPVRPPTTTSSTAAAPRRPRRGAQPGERRGRVAAALATMPVPMIEANQFGPKAGAQRTGRRAGRSRSSCPGRPGSPVAPPACGPINCGYASTAAGDRPHPLRPAAQRRRAGQHGPRGARARHLPAGGQRPAALAGAPPRRDAAGPFPARLDAHPDRRSVATGRCPRSTRPRLWRPASPRCAPTRRAASRWPRASPSPNTCCPLADRAQGRRSGHRGRADLRQLRRRCGSGPRGCGSSWVSSRARTSRKGSAGQGSCAGRTGHLLSRRRIRGGRCAAVGRGPPNWRRHRWSAANRGPARARHWNGLCGPHVDGAHPQSPRWRCRRPRRYQGGRGRRHRAPRCSQRVRRRAGAGRGHAGPARGARSRPRQAVARYLAARPDRREDRLAICSRSPCNRPDQQADQQRRAGRAGWSAAAPEP